VIADRDTFGPRLRVERERRGISLRNVAESTKIKESLFVELERNDFSKWPQGIFRRAHLCAYVSAIGLPPQPILAEFLQLFPEPCPLDQFDRPGVDNAAPVQHAEQTLKPHRVAPSLVDRIWVVFFDLAAVCLMSSMLAAIVDITLWSAIACVGLAYSAIGSAYFAQSIGTYVQERMNAILQIRRRPQAAVQTPLREVHQEVRQVHQKVRPLAPQPTRSSFSHGDPNREREVESRRASA
jgi:transcriptional regulator with XRE-family HTH domain